MRSSLGGGKVVDTSQDPRKVCVEAAWTVYNRRVQLARVSGPRLCSIATTLAWQCALAAEGPILVVGGLATTRKYRRAQRGTALENGLCLPEWAARSVSRATRGLRQVVPTSAAATTLASDHASHMGSLWRASHLRVLRRGPPCRRFGWCSAWLHG